MLDEHRDSEDNSSPPQSAPAFVPLYDAGEFQEYLAPDVASRLPETPVQEPAWSSTLLSNAALSPRLVSSGNAQAPTRKPGGGKSLLLALLALLLVASVGGGFLFYTLRLRPQPLPVKNCLIPSSPQALFKQVTSRKPVLYDQLSNEGASTWASLSETNGDGYCAFESDGYHVKITKADTLCYCISRRDYLVNFAFQVQVTILSGDGASVTFRGSRLLNKLYRFRIDQYGYYALLLHNDPSFTSAPTTLRTAPSQYINAGLGQTNVMTVIAVGSDIYLYANSHFISHERDSTLSAGQIGLGASDYTKSTEVVFSQARLWTL